MKVLNGSPNILKAGEVFITHKDIAVGQDPRAIVGASVFILGAVLGFFMPGSFLIYWGLGFVGGVWLAMSTTDNRKKYLAGDIVSIQYNGASFVGTKGAGGSLGGAAVGGVLFGGSGAVVGAIASGNNIEQINNLAIKFNDGEWAVLSGGEDYKTLLTMAGSKNLCPI
jgi:hypothetical protein